MMLFRHYSTTGIMAQGVSFRVSSFQAAALFGGFPSRRDALSEHACGMFVAQAGSGSDREKLSAKQTDEVSHLENLQYIRQKSGISASIMQISDSNGASSSAAHAAPSPPRERQG